MFNDDDVKSTLIKVGAMLLIVAVEWWTMQPYHEPLLGKLWYMLAKLCYKIAGKAGSMGLNFEYSYYEVMS
jgi:hypothetical protein